MSKYGVISGPYFPVFGLNIEKYGPEITPYLGTFHAVIMVYNVQDLGQIIVDMSLFERIQVSGNPYMREYRSVETLIWENTGQWKPLFSHILCSVRIKPKANGEELNWLLNEYNYFLFRLLTLSLFVDFKPISRIWYEMKYLNSFFPTFYLTRCSLSVSAFSNYVISKSCQITDDTLQGTFVNFSWRPFQVANL